MDLFFQGRPCWFTACVRTAWRIRANFFGAHALELDRGNVTTLVLGAGVEAILAAGYMTDDPRPFVAAAEKTIVGSFDAAAGPRPTGTKRR
jgi:hypothetical protein